MFVVVESCEDYYMPLVLRTGEKFPPEGILDWQDGREPFAVFPTRRAARAAIRRTGHYAKAWEQTEGMWPAPAACSVEPLLLVDSLGVQHGR